MSRQGDCWDNAVAESFFASMKREMEDIDDLETRAAATLSIGEYIDGLYNFRRRHSTINYNSPVEFELIDSVTRRERFILDLCDGPRSVATAGALSLTTTVGSAIVVLDRLV
jgi:hypothetical protein